MTTTAPQLQAVPSPVLLIPARDFAHPERALERGEIVSVRRGIYTPGPAWRALAPWDRYLARVHAAALALPGAVFSHESAAALLGLPGFGDPGTVHVLRDPVGTARAVGGVRTHTTTRPRELVDLGGIGVTAPAETAVDLARGRHEAIGLAVADAVLRFDPSVTVEVLVARNEARGSSRGRRQARWPLHRATGAAETTLESVSRAAIEWLGFPEPTLQAWFTSTDGIRDRADMAWLDDKVVGEADGDLKYDGRYGDPTAVLRERRRRDARLREHVRSVAHWAWDDVMDHPRLRSILLGAGVRRIRPEDSAHLFDLRRLLARR